LISLFGFIFVPSASQSTNKRNRNNENNKIVYNIRNVKDIIRYYRNTTRLVSGGTREGKEEGERRLGHIIQELGRLENGGIVFFFVKNKLL